MLKFVYSFFLGLLLAVFVGLGVATFYPEPKAPEYPTTSHSASLTYDPATNPEDAKQETLIQSQAEKEYQATFDVYSKKLARYNRNVAMMVLGAAVILSVLGLVLESRIHLLADGLLLGGTFTLLYSIGRSFAGNDPKYSFTVVTIGIVITVAVGYMKFIKPMQAVPAKPTKSRK